MLKPIARASCLALALCLLPGLSARAVSLSIEPASTAVDLGDPVELSILVSGLGGGSAPSLGVYSFDVEFDASVLDFQSVSFGDPMLGDQLDLAGFGSIQLSTLAPGVLSLFELSLDPAALLDADQEASFILAVLDFDTLAEAATTLSLSSVTLGDAEAAPIVPTLSGAELRVGSSSSTQVPEPSSALMLVLGTLLIRSRLGS